MESETNEPYPTIPGIVPLILNKICFLRILSTHVVEPFYGTSVVIFSLFLISIWTVARHVCGAVRGMGTFNISHCMAETSLCDGSVQIARVMAVAMPT